MKQINIRLDDHIVDAFYRFCQRQGTRPTALISSIIDFYGRSEILTEKMEGGQIAKDEVLVQFGQIVADMQKLSRANGEFKKAIGDVMEPYGIKIDELGLI
ncbi:MAG: hypothetical protein U9Q17_01565 [Chloroflexota bacterium]|nr:hypothetical protein [Chloroflexota bacterium]